MGPTKEEKRAKKEAKRLEKLRAQIELRKKAKRVEIQRELAAQALKKKHVEKALLDLMLKIKEPEFKKDTEVFWHIFERTLDRKDHVIDYTLKLIDVADDQFQRTVSSFCISIDAMIVKFLEDLDVLSKQNNIRTANILNMWEEEAAKITKDHDNAETHLQLMIYHGFTRSDDKIWRTRGENMVKQDEDRTKFSFERESLRSYLENTYNLLWDEYKGILKDYVVGTADIQKEIRKLRFKENIMSDIIATQGKRIANNNGVLKRLRTELAAYESGTKQAIFRDRRDRHRVAAHKLKKRLINGCSMDLTKIELLVKVSDGAIEWLEGATKKGSNILRLAALCRKFEGQREKVLPFGSTVPHSPVYATNKTRHFKAEKSLILDALSSTCGLTRLWQRISQVELTKKALYREKLLLEQENAYIIQKIKDFQDNKYGPGSQKCSCIGKKGMINPPTSVKGILEISKYTRA